MRWWASPNKLLFLVILVLVISTALGASTFNRASNSLGQDLGPYSEGPWRLETGADSRALYYDDQLYWREYSVSEGDLLRVERVDADSNSTVRTYRKGSLESYKDLDMESSYTTDATGLLIHRLDYQRTSGQQTIYTYETLHGRLERVIDGLGIPVYSKREQESSPFEISGYNGGRTGSLAAIGEDDTKEQVVQELIAKSGVEKQVEHRHDGSRVETFIVNSKAYCEVHYGPHSERVLFIIYL